MIDPVDITFFLPEMKLASIKSEDGRNVILYTDGMILMDKTGRIEYAKEIEPDTIKNIVFDRAARDTQLKRKDGSKYIYFGNFFGYMTRLECWAEGMNIYQPPLPSKLPEYIKDACVYLDAQKPGQQKETLK